MKAKTLAEIINEVNFLFEELETKSGKLAEILGKERELLTFLEENYNFVFKEINPSPAVILSRANSTHLEREYRENLIERARNFKCLAIAPIKLERREGVENQDLYSKERLVWGASERSSLTVDLAKVKYMDLLLGSENPEKEWKILDVRFRTEKENETEFGGNYYLTYVFSYRLIILDELFNYLRNFFVFIIPTKEEKEIIEKKN